MIYFIFLWSLLEVCGNCDVVEGVLGDTQPAILLAVYFIGGLVVRLGALRHNRRATPHLSPTSLHERFY